MPAPETSSAQEVRAAIAALRAAAANSGKEAAQTIAALQKTALILSDARDPIALDLRRGLQDETGLSLPMIEWGLVTSLSSMRHAPLAELARLVPKNAPREVIGVVLAGNVFVAAVRGLALPLLAGAHVIAKTASSEGAFARAFKAALTQADAAIGARLAIVQFSRADEAATRALCSGVDALSIYGSDDTVEQLQRLCVTSTLRSALTRSKRSASSATHDRAGARHRDDAPPEASRAAVNRPSELAAVGLPPESSVASNDRPSARRADSAAEASASPSASSNEASPQHIASGRDNSSIEADTCASASSNEASARRSVSDRDDAPTTASASSNETSAAPRIIAHGHGLSAAYVARSALSSAEQVARAAERVALDISAYDQHGCLSPHFVLVEPGGTIEPQAFAQLLAAHALPALAQLLPPAEPTLHEQAERMQWQATAAVRGDLHVYPTHAVSFEERPLRPSPGGRQISVYACANHTELAELLAPFAEHLKCIGIAGSRAERAKLTDHVQRFSAAQVCRSGEMQSPPFDTWADGRPPLAGLFGEGQH